MQTFNKLVRDKIPEMIERNGGKCKFKKLDKEIYIKELRKKFIEEMNEYLQSKNNNEAIEELADVLEIIHSLSKIHGKSIEEVEKARQQKLLDRGGFNNMLYLIEVENN